VYWYNGDIEWLESKAITSRLQKKVVFYGSSSITRWESLEKDFTKFQGVNLGFGGSTLASCAWFFHRVVPRHHPDAIVIYAGDNDLGDGRSPEEVVLFYHQLISNIRNSLGEIPVLYISIKLSPRRENLRGSIEYANACILESINSVNDNIHYIDLFHRMLDGEGKIKMEYYDPDGLHLSDEGYDLWHSEIESKISAIFQI